MRVSDDGNGEDSIEDRVGGRHGGGTSERDEGGTEEALKGPVVTAVSLVGVRERSRVVDGSINVCEQFGISKRNIPPSLEAGDGRPGGETRRTTWEHATVRIVSSRNAAG